VSDGPTAPRPSQRGGGVRCEALARDKADEFAFIVAPLKLRGGTGSSVAPIAVR
jgi:hypothetical protein